MKIIRKVEVFEPHRLTLGDLRNLVEGTKDLDPSSKVDIKENSNQRDGESFSVVITETKGV